jgi:hypothetical protein
VEMEQPISGRRAAGGVRRTLQLRVKRRRSRDGRQGTKTGVSLTAWGRGGARAFSCFRCRSWWVDAVAY